MPRKKHPERLVIDKDWGSSVLWGPSKKYGGLANYSTYEEFGFPDWLIRKFDFWSAWYEHNDPLRMDETMDWELWNAYGIALAIDVKRIVGDKYAVYYYPEREIPFIPFDVDWLPPRDDLDKENYQY